MHFIQLFSEKVKNKNSGSIVEIIRCKNGWTTYNPQYPQYTDIKLNVLVKPNDDIDGTIIAEVQFLLDLMSKVCCYNYPYILILILFFNI